MSDNSETDISNSDLKTEIEKILKNADLSTTSAKKVIQQLEKNLGMDLSKKKDVIDKMVMDYVNSMESSEEEDEDDSGKEAVKKEEEASEPSAESEEEKPKKRKKRSDDEWGSGGKKKKEAKPKPKKAAGGGGRGKGSGYTRAYKLSSSLAELMGEEELPRHEVVKRVWAIIKKKNLYDPNNKQFAICDDALYKVIGAKRFRIFAMMKYLKTHFLDD